MFACYYPVKIKELPHVKSFDKFRFVNIVNLSYCVDKFKMNDIIKSILIDFCKVSVIGYDNSKEKYWCKKFTDSTCELHLELEIYGKGFNISEIKIIPLIGNDNNIEKFIKTLNESIKNYQTYPFMKSLLESPRL